MSRRFSAACERNRGPILDVLREVLAPGSRVLEVASGTGMHAAWMATHLDVDWQPTDPTDEALASIAAWRDEVGAPAGLRPPVRLDVCGAWPAMEVDAVFCANMIHIAPWEACLGLLRGAHQVVRPGGWLLLYGPFRRPDRALEASNESFDLDLRSRDERWGIRELTAVDAVAAGWTRTLLREMPANNLIVGWRRDA